MPILLLVSNDNNQKKQQSQYHSGRQIFDKFCSVCHSSDFADVFEAPEVHNQKVWKERQNNIFNNLVASNNTIKNLKGDKKNKVIIEGLVASAKQGFDNMPPKGQCDDCTDEDMKKVIEFMMSKKK